MLMPQVQEMRAIATTAANARNIPVSLLLRIVDVESNWDPWAARYEPAFGKLHFPRDLRLTTSRVTEQELQRTSWGLCQIMGATARRLGWLGPLPALCDPITNLDLAALYLKTLYQDGRGNGTWRWAITAYNHGERWEEIDKSWYFDGYTRKFHDLLTEIEAP